MRPLELLRATLLYTAVTIALAWPLSVRPASAVMSAAPDTDLFLWTLSWNAHAVVSQPTSWFDANIYHPERRTLAYSENLVGTAIPATPILWATGNPVLAMNAVVLLAAVLCGLGACVLARTAGASHAGALVAGMIFAFSPPRFLRLDQVHLAVLQWVPFGLAAWYAYLQRGRARDLRLAAACATLQALSSGHGVVFLALGMIVLLVARLASAGWWSPVRALRDLGVSGALLVVPALLVAWPYRVVQREMGLRRTLDDGWAYPASSFLASPTHLHSYLLSWVPSWRINETAGAYLFPGLLPLALAAVAVGHVCRGRRRGAGLPRQSTDGARVRLAVAAFAAIAMICVWLSIGRPFGLWPSVYWWPVLNFIRVPSRFMMLAVLAVGVLAAFGVDAMTARLNAPRRGLVVALVCLGLLVEFDAAPFELDPYTMDRPAADAWLARQPKPFVVAEVPVGDPANMGQWERREAAFMLHSTLHWQKTVHGYSGFRPERHDRLFRELRGFPDAPSLASLRQFGVTYVVVHKDRFREGEWEGMADRLSRAGEWLALVHDDPAGQVYTVTRGAAGN